MNKEQANELATKELANFKKRMKIFGKSEDENLENILSASFMRINQLVGPYDANNDLNFIELVFERSRYAYNDSIEYFEGNFQSFILDYSLQNMIMDGD
ncbi:hypothetical protein ACFQOY_13675 [Enterococcus alcedinis]|uniref:Phage gp6-like head-tail connector protein n=1 Tax=Enterococcus alcedinis TaxID=1274384 RepID=A0A917JGA3_9ENTE|nr:hypothetical protein [Enterococcus alcedinis]MBP2100965.1 hypothetical protein [Enterococcus alcedinis]GGI64739.1 hypothetical protein GCM10011482_03930 [Enterococcus alcedinis]